MFSISLKANCKSFTALSSIFTSSKTEIPLATELFILALSLTIEYAPNITANTILVGFSAYMLWSNRILLKEFRSIARLIENNANLLKDMKSSNEQLHKEVEAKRALGHEAHKMMNEQIKDELKDIRHRMDMLQNSCSLSSSALRLASLRFMLG